MRKIKLTSGHSHLCMTNNLILKALKALKDLKALKNTRIILEKYRCWLQCWLQCLQRVLFLMCVTSFAYCTIPVAIIDFIHRAFKYLKPLSSVAKQTSTSEHQSGQIMTLWFRKAHTHVDGCLYIQSNVHICTHCAHCTQIYTE